MGKTVKTIAITVGLAIVTGGIAGALAPAAFGAATVAAGAAAGAQMAAIGALVSSGVGLISKAFVKKPSMDMAESIGRLNLSIDPQAFGKIVVGETAAATDVIYAEQHGANDQYISQIIAAAAHRIDSYVGLWVNDEAITFSGSAATGAWASQLWKNTSNLGTDSQTHLTGTQAMSWPSSADGRGMAHFLLQWQLGKAKTQSGLPSRITMVVKGVPVYDPRSDSTRGGSGSHRADDQSTWEYNNVTDGDIGSNWALVVAMYLLGWHTEDGNDKLIFGVGIDPDDIDWDSVITAANECDVLVDGIPRYYVGGVLPITQDHDAIIRQLEGAIGGRVSKIGGKYFIWAPNDDLSPLETITDDDLVRDVGVEFIPSGPIENLYNTARGLYIEPDSLYQAVPYPEVTESTAVTEDGRERILEHNFSMIQDVGRAERIARMLVRRSRFTATWRFAMGPKGLLFRPFSVFTLNIAETNYEDVTVRIISMTYSLAGIVVIECIEEDSSIYDVSQPLGTPVTQLDPGSFDPSTTVSVAGLAVADTSITGSAGTASDALSVTWTDPGALVARTEIRYRKNGATDWVLVPPANVDFTNAIIVGVEPGTNYDVQARHITIFNAVGAWSSTVNETSGTTETAAALVNQGNLATLDTVDTAQIEDDAVQTAKVLNNAITKDESVITSAAISNSVAEGWEAIQSVAVDNTGAGAPFPVVIMVSFLLESTSGATNNVNVRIDRDGTTVYGPVVVEAVNTGKRMVTFVTVDTPGSADLYSYSCDIDTNGGTVEASERAIVALGVKK